VVVDADSRTAGSGLELPGIRRLAYYG